MAEPMGTRCGPHCGTAHGQTRHCTRCHEEYDFPMRSRPAHGPGKVHGG